MELTRRQRNEIFQALEVGGINPADCMLDYGVIPNWDRPEVGKPIPDAVILRHSPSGSSVRWAINRRSSGYYRVGFDVPDGPSEELYAANFPRIVEEIPRWAEEARYVCETPDFWAELRQVPEILAAAQAADASNAPFTADEQDEIARRLDEVKQLVRAQFELTDEQLATMDQRLDEVKEEAKRQGRKTWLYTFYGAVMSTFMTDEIPPHVIQTIVTAVVHGIAHIFGIGGPPPIIST